MWLFEASLVWFEINQLIFLHSLFQILILILGQISSNYIFSATFPNDTSTQAVWLLVDKKH